MQIKLALLAESNQMHTFKLQLKLFNEYIIFSVNHTTEIVMDEQGLQETNNASKHALACKICALNKTMYTVQLCLELNFKS